MTERPWHERTPHVVGASIAALIAIALLYFAATWLTRHYNQPAPPPVPVIVDNSTTPHTAASTTSATTTSSSTTPPSTTDIDLPLTTDTTTSTTPTTETSITQSRQSHTTNDPRWPYPFTSRPHTTVLPQPPR
ncbi:hypothetical protein FZI85_26055 [Mycobacterium sp. CBMA293]|uniref:hypothetical protein n=1 Tax=unclassified Mycolicibacterium TaxID=2636767 RepID=UPI0012DF750B|nr:MULTISPECIES: hypothetical protein [unclassified Mycolicibacterium]MUL47780.1 hypothetical protein [Mycolicibacterium sp. CBMA 360]MUL61702.1 hypothetical protein [Mycolicibacterium sp. CBMA 335]MUL70766.1 hypothetical protein [Mycolicibacterium sp. CBMA 311]MUL97348.1 hypothetical protein [Mycolicibacterium sp. CBMA 230]MUM08551.1 hypothetical protein [Mycolicibacterium sp. CBMA 213]